MEMNFGVTVNGKDGVVRHNYGSFYSYGKKYTQLDFSGMPSIRYDIDLFVRIPKSEIPK